MSKMTISELAKQTNVNITTIRYYEKRGLIAPTLRTDSGYRVFSEESIMDIAMIKYAQSLGFTLEEIKKILLIFTTEEHYPTDNMHQQAITKLEEINKQLIKLNNLKSLLENVIHFADSQLPIPKEMCPLMQSLAERRDNYGETN